MPSKHARGAHAASGEPRRGEGVRLPAIRHYWLTYTACFLALGVVVFSGMVVFDRTFIWRPDGWHQHYRALIYYGQYLRRILYGILNGRPALEEWDFSLGEGADIFSTFHYYGIGDPFTVFAMLVPTGHMAEFYGLTVVAKLYCAGIAYSKMCLGFGERQHAGVLAGSLAYVFCGWNLINACRHPMFLNPTVYLPLLVWGVERIVRGRTPHVFVAAVLLSTVSNFYFLFMLTLVTLGYVIIRLLPLLRRQLGEGLLLLLRISLFALVGVALGSACFLPFLRTVLGNARLSGETARMLVYPLSYYLALPGALTAVMTDTSAYWTYIGLSAPTLVATLLLLRRRRRHPRLFVLVLLTMLMTCVPLAGSLLNALSYVTNRWIWALALPWTYCLTCLWDDLLHLGSADRRYLLKGLALLTLLCLALESSRTLGTLAGLAVGFAFVALLSCLDGPEPAEGDEARRTCLPGQRVAVAAVCAGVVVNALVLYSAPGSNYAADLVTYEEARTSLRENESRSVEIAADEDGREGVVRYSGRALTTNGSIPGGTSSTQFYWSFANPYVGEFRRALELLETNAHDYRVLDDRSELLATASVDYFTTPLWDHAPVPVGYSQEGRDIAGYLVHDGEHTLPLAYAYDRYLDRAAWDALPVVDRQASLLEAAVLEEAPGVGTPAETTTHYRELDYELAYDGGSVYADDGAIVTMGDNAQVTLNFAGDPGCVTYVELEGLTYSAVPGLDLYENDRYDPLGLHPREAWDELSRGARYRLLKGKLLWSQPWTSELTLVASDGVSRRFNYYTPASSLYADYHDYLVNFGFADAARTSVTITFGRAGRYEFDALRVLCQPVEGLPAAVDALASRADVAVSTDVDAVSVQVAAAQDCLLCLSIPYGEGWSATLDGAETRLLRANVKNMAVELPAGKHQVTLTYRTPWLREGCLVSAVGFVAYLASSLVIASGKRNARRR